MDGMTEIPVVDLGRGVAMPMVGFGTWQMQGQQAQVAVRHALQAGYRHLDTATIYRNEAEVGRAIAGSGLDRSDIFVTTKLPPGNAGRARATIAESLRAPPRPGAGPEDIFFPPQGPPRPPRGAPEPPSPRACAPSAPATSTCGSCTGRPAGALRPGCGRSSSRSRTRACAVRSG